MSSRLLALLKAAAGEASLLSRLGRWRQAISLQVDALAAPTYVLAAQIAGQAIADLAAATTIIFDSLGASIGSGISLNTATGEFTLGPGIYELDARIDYSGFNTVATDIAYFHWEDSLVNDLSHGAIGVSVPPASTQNLAPQPSVKGVITVTTSAVVRLISSGGQGAAFINTGSHATVKKIG